MGRSLERIARVPTSIRVVSWRMPVRALIPTLAGMAVVSVLAVALRAEAQQPAKIPRIAYVSGNLAGIPHRMEAFRQGLRDLGYDEGKNVIIEWRSAARKSRQAVMAELVRLDVDVIVTAGGGPTRSAKEATNTIPIVMTQDRDPVANGFVLSLARPGRNVTGLSRLAPGLSGKQLGLLKEIVPGLSQLAAFYIATQQIAPVLKEIDLVAGALGIKLQAIEVSHKHFDSAFREAIAGHADGGVWLVPDPFYNRERTRIPKLAAENHLPVIYFRRVDVEAGGLISYGIDFTDLDRRATVYVDKILKGAKPADLPVEQPTKFDLSINLKTAKQLGIAIPSSILYRADKVIK